MLLTDDEILNAINDAPLAQGPQSFVLAIGRAIERLVLEKAPAHGVLRDLTLENCGGQLWLRVRSDSFVGAFDLGAAGTTAGYALAHWFMRKQAVLHGQGDPDGMPAVAPALKLWCSGCNKPTTWALTLELWKANYAEKCPACGGEITMAQDVSGVPPSHEPQQEKDHG